MFRTVALALLCLALNVACTGLGGRLPDPQRHQVENARAVPLEAHRSVERDLPLPLEPGQTLVLADHYGDVVFTADASGPARCHAVVEISAKDQATAAALERTIGLISSQTEEGLRILLNEPEREDDLIYVTSASLEVFVPPGTPLRIQLVRGSVNGVGPFGQALVETGRGDVRLRRVDGGVIARSGAGDVKLRQCTGGPVRASTDAGMIALLGSRTETARLETGRGRIVVNTASGGTFECVARQGSVRLVGVDANVTIEADSGVHVEDHEGKSLRIEKGEGGAYLANVRVGTLELRSEGGGLEIERLSADQATLSADKGKLTLTDIKGTLTASTGDGDVDAVLLAGPKSTLETEVGGLKVHDVRGAVVVRAGRGRTNLTKVHGDVEVRSRQGPVAVKGLLAGVVVEGAEGGVHVRALAGSTPRGPWRISSGRGDLILNTPPDLGYRLDARAEDGVIDSAFPIVLGAGVAQEANSVRGEVAGGGPLVELHCEHGNIALRRQVD